MTKVDKNIDFLTDDDGNLIGSRNVRREDGNPGFNDSYLAVYATDTSGNVTGLVGPGGVTLEIERVHAQSAIAIGIAPSGTMGANGAVTLGTSIRLNPYATGLYLYYPAAAVYSASPAGFYWTVMGSDTAGVVYNDVYSPSTNLPAVPATPAAIVAAGPGAFTGVTTEVAAQYVTIPADSLGPNGHILFMLAGSHTNSAGNKTYAIYIDGNLMSSNTGTTSATLALPTIAIFNRGVTDRQVCISTTAGVSSGNISQSSVNTAATFVVEIRLRHSSAATDWVVLEYSKITTAKRA